MKIQDLKIRETFDVSTVKHIADMTDDQFRAFHKDLVNWRSTLKAFRSANEMMGGDVLQFDDSFITWVYGHEQEGDIKFEVINKKGEKVEHDPMGIVFKFKGDKK